MILDGDELWHLLRSLDDPEHLEFPADYDHGETRSRFNRLVDRLDAAFSCSCVADRDVQDASLHGRIVIPVLATETSTQLVISVSNFGDLAVVAVDNPGSWAQEEFTELLKPRDAERIYSALDDLGYTVIPEEPLWEPYDGNIPRDVFSPADATWWLRFFDYL